MDSGTVTEGRNHIPNRQEPASSSAFRDTPNTTVGTPGIFFKEAAVVSTILVKKYEDRKSDQVVET